MKMKKTKNEIIFFMIQKAQKCADFCKSADKLNGTDNIQLLL